MTVASLLASRAAEDPVLSTLHNAVLETAVHNTDDSDCVGACIRNWKIGFSALLIVEGLVFAHIIFFLRSWKSFNKDSVTLQKVKHFGNALSAGIFLSAGLLHLLPEAVELFEGHGHGEEEEEGEEHEGEEEEGEEHEGEEEEEVEFPWAFFVIMVSYYAVLATERVIIPRLIGTTSCDLEDNGHHTHEPVKVSSSEEGAHTEQVVQVGLRSPQFVRGFTRVMALSLHSLFECMALGLSSSFSTTLNIFIALVSHRWATAVSIAFNLAWSLNYLPFLILVLVFTLTVPVGVGVGAALSGLDETVQGVFFAISTATFIYIGAFAAVTEEFIEHTAWIVRKFAFMLLGATIISVITGILVANDIHG